MTLLETRVIRGCAIFDLVVTGLMALPPTAVLLAFVATEWLGTLLQWFVLRSRPA